MHKKLMGKTRQFQFLEKTSDLRPIVEKLEEEKVIAVDVEADSMFRFREKVCLIQIASRKHSIIIDTMKIKDPSLLKPVFLNNNIQKVFHGADFDIRSLYRDFRIRVNNLFDTELASRFAGAKETGLDSVLKENFGVEMDKRFQKKDWSQRPLPEEMIEYAANDVIYLIPLAGILKKELRKSGRLSWVQEECETLSKVRPVPAAFEEPLFVKLRGAGRLDSFSLAVLEALLQYRLKVAEKKDLPTFKVMSNNTLLKLAKEKPRSIQALMKNNILSKKQREMYGKGVVEAVNKAVKLPKEKRPIYPRSRAPVLKPSVHKRIKILKEWRNTAAERLAMDPGLFINKAVLTAIASQKPVNVSELKNITGFKDWQRHHFGEEILNVLQDIK